MIHHFVGWLDFPLFNFPFPTFPFVKSLDVFIGSSCKSLHSLMHVDIPISRINALYPSNMNVIYYSVVSPIISHLVCLKTVYSQFHGKKHDLSSRNGHLGQIQTSFSWSHLPFPSNSLSLHHYKMGPPRYLSWFISG